MSVQLPFDPASLQPEDRGERRTTLDKEHEEAIEHVRSAFKEAGFGMATEFSPSELLNEKVDADRDPYYVLGACNPATADEALDASDGLIGGLFPCNVVIWEESPGTQVVYHVSIMKIARLVGIAPNTERWERIVEETGERVERAWSKL